MVKPAETTNFHTETIVAPCRPHYYNHKQYRYISVAMIKSSNTMIKNGAVFSQYVSVPRISRISAYTF